MKELIKLLKKNWKSILFYFLVFLLFLYNFIFLKWAVSDNYWNFGAAYNIATGMIPYKDFNLLTLPLAPMIISIFLNIFGKKMIVFYIINSILLTLIVYLTSKLEKSTRLIVAFILSLFCATSYNALSVVLIVLLLLLEKNKKSDFLIGFIVGLSILTKQVLGLLIIPLFLVKNKKDFLRRLMGLFIPAQLFLLYLYKSDSLIECIDYALLGMFDFGGNNSNFTVWTLIAIIIIISSIYKFFKTKDKLYLYALVSMIIAAPIFDVFHTLYSAVPFIILTCKSDKKMEQIVNVLFIFFIVITLISGTIKQLENNHIYLNTERDSTYYLNAHNDVIIDYKEDIANYYYSKKDEYNIYFLDNAIYYVKLEYNIPINKFDLFLKGNNGYNGNQKLINEIKKMKEPTLFLVDERMSKEEVSIYDQTNFELIEFVAKNYEKIDSIVEGYNVYKIVNE